jgi:hypothetical protein
MAQVYVRNISFHRKIMDKMLALRKRDYNYSYEFILIQYNIDKTGSGVGIET